MFWNNVRSISFFILMYTFTLFADDLTDNFMLEDGNFTALKGFDVVSYFEGSPVKGSEDFQTEYVDVNWYFTNQKNLDKFLTSPERYLPKYDAHCAVSISNDKLREGSPLDWHIYDGDLYFLCSKEDVQKFKNDPGHISEKADEKWEKMMDRWFHQILNEL